MSIQYQWIKRINSTARQWVGLSTSSDGKNICAAGNSNLSTSPDYGITWTDQTAMAPSSIASSSDGTKLVCSITGKILTSTNSGVSWVDRTTSSSALDFRFVTSSEDGVYLSAGRNTSPATFNSSSSGVTWGGSDTTGIGLLGPFASSSTGRKLIGVSLGTTGAIYTSTYYGSDWTARPDGIGLRDFLSVATSSDGSKLVAGADYIYTSINNGIDWTQSGSPLGIWAYISCSSDGSKILAADQSSQYLYVSLNRGTTWSAQLGTGKKAWGPVAWSGDGSRLVASAIGYWVDGTYGGSFVANDYIYTAQFQKKSGSWGPFLKAKIS